MPGFGKGTFAKKRRAKRLGSECSHCVRLACKNPHCKALGMVSVNRENKIKFVKDGMSKESLNDILRSLETHPSESFNVKFIIYGSCSKRKVHTLILGI